MERLEDDLLVRHLARSFRCSPVGQRRYAGARPARRRRRARRSPPAPDAPLPRGVEPTARRLAATTASLHAAVDDWRAAGTPRQPRELRLWALHQQRLYLALGLAPQRRADAVVARLPATLRADARDVVAARRSLVRLTPPTRLPLSAFRTGPAEPADRLLAHYGEAERRFGVPWDVLAAVNFVESAFGKVRSQSTAGAQGPMQFLPATWRAYGLGGDVHDPRDAILGAANLLRASGAPAGPPPRAPGLQPLDALRRRRARLRSRHAPRPPRVLRLPRLAGLRPHPVRLPAAHEPVSVRRLEHVPGFGIDRVAAAAGDDPEVLRHGEPRHGRPAARPPRWRRPARRSATDEANSWLPFTGATT